MTVTYIAETRRSLLNALGDISWADDFMLLDLYALLVLVKGEECTAGDIHDAWAVARTWSRPGHPDIVPFESLPERIQEYDVRYRDAVRAAAHQLREQTR